MCNVFYCSCSVRAKALSCFAQFTALAGDAASSSIPEMLAAPTAKTGKTPALALATVIQQQVCQSHVQHLMNNSRGGNNYNNNDNNNIDLYSA